MSALRKPDRLPALAASQSEHTDMSSLQQAVPQSTLRPDTLGVEFLCVEPETFTYLWTRPHPLVDLERQCRQSKVDCFRHDFSCCRQRAQCGLAATLNSRGEAGTLLIEKLE